MKKIILVVLLCGYLSDAQAFAPGFLQAACSSSAAPAGCSGTYGNTTDSATGLGEGSLMMAVKKITGACDGNTASITIRGSYFNHTTSGGRYTYVIYSDNAGEPSTLLGSVVGTQTNNGPADVTETLVVDTNATTFWIGLRSEANVAATYTSATGGVSRWMYSCSGTYDAPPSTWGSGCTNDGDYVAYNMEMAVNY